MATALHGKDGAAYVGGTIVALVNNWSLSGGPTWDDITAMDSNSAGQIIAGIRRWTGSIAVRYATDDTNGQNILRANAFGGTIVSLKLYPSNTGGGTANFFSGSAGLTMDLNAAHDAVDEATYNFESHGPWTYA